MYTLFINNLVHLTDQLLKQQQKNLIFKVKIQNKAGDEKINFND